MKERPKIISLKKKTRPLKTPPDLGGISSNYQIKKGPKNSRTILYFIIIMIIIIITYSTINAGIKLESSTQDIALSIEKIVSESHELKKAIEAKDPEAIKNEIKNLHKITTELQAQITQLSIVESSIKTSPIDNYKNLIEALSNITQAASNFLDAIPQSIATINPKELIESANQIAIALDNTEKKLSETNMLNIPSDAREQIKLLKEDIKEINKVLKEGQKYIPNITAALGYPDPKTYLILFQNTAEARPTGGFIGTFALASFNDGKLIDLKLEDVYKYDGRLFNQVAAPEHLQRFRSGIALRDSNHNRDFPTSAKSAMWFLENAGGPTVDGVVAINQTILEDILSMIGPQTIFYKSNPITINEYNYFEVLQYIIESDKDNAISPKQTLFELISEIRRQIMEVDSQFVESSLNIIKKHIEEGKIYTYFKDNTLQEFAKTQEIDGSLPEIASDGLAILRTSLSGNKSDQYFFDDVTHKTLRGITNNLEGEIIIKTKHLWNNGNKKFFADNFDNFQDLGNEKQNDLLSILGAGPNNTLYQFLLPKDIEIISINGLQKKEEIYKTESYANLSTHNLLLETTTENPRQIKIHYSLPFEYSDSYTFKLIPQSGNHNTITKIWDNQGIQTKEKHTFHQVKEIDFPK